jgi:hypothetical protein
MFSPTSSFSEINGNPFKLKAYIFKSKQTVIFLLAYEEGVCVLQYLFISPFKNRSGCTQIYMKKQFRVTSVWEPLLGLHSRKFITV